ncbi:pyridoxamine 5'-phosphate oxidase family protein [Nocardia pneumoniae]|uniref:pyridoxamine 5'-phosphate oxidase family protein n=1 Tax=Nocardia pneumoniae TaxID=228601 RepID=UPI0002D5737B|nr:pyridoxamine 5'-phosphate oxidase family protein [Nocardia pneumoniae]
MTERITAGPTARATVALDRAEAMRLLAGVPIGRVVFTRNALPAIRPVNHLVDDRGAIIVRTRLSSGLTTAVRGNSPVVVAYEADEIDPVRHLGWSVVVVGLAHPVTDPARAAHYEQLLRPWVDGVTDAVIAIEPDIVTGLRLIENER